MMLGRTAGRRGFNPLSLFAAGEAGVLYDVSDLSTMSQDATGNTPAVVNQPVGLLLDKSRGLALGAEQLANGDLSNGTTSWNATSANLSVVNGFLRVENSGALYGFASQPYPVVAGKWYIATCDKGGSSGVAGAISAGPGAGNLTYSTPGTRLIFQALTTGTYHISVWAGQNVAGQYNEYDNISCKELAGNHAVQATTAAKPILRQMYNFTGAELVPNSDFSLPDISQWELTNATAEVVGGRLRVTNTLAGSTGYASIPIATVVGATYRIAADLFPGTAGSVRLRVGTTKGASQLLAATSAGAVPAEFVALTTVTWITCIINSTTVGIYAEWDNISLVEGAGTGRYYLEFDGVDDRLIATIPLTGAAFDRISNIRQLSWTSLDRIYANSNGGLLAGILYQNTASPRLQIYNGVNGPISDALAVGTDGIVTERHNGANSRIAVGNAAYASGDTGAAAATGITIGGENGGAQAGNFRMYGLLMRDGATLTDPQIISVREFLAPKSGVVL
jgi:hypothetical protein